MDDFVIGDSNKDSHRAKKTLTCVGKVLKEKIGTVLKKPDIRAKISKKI